MWIFTPKGFLSAVVDNDKPNSILVRARKAGDLLEFLKAIAAQSQPEILVTPHADYRFRVTVPRKQFEKAVAKLAEEIDYPNFKAAVSARYPDPALSGILGGLWHELRDWQQS